MSKKSKILTKIILILVIIAGILLIGKIVNADYYHYTWNNTTNTWDYQYTLYNDDTAVSTGTKFVISDYVGSSPESTYNLLINALNKTSTIYSGDASLGISKSSYKQWYWLGASVQYESKWFAGYSGSWPYVFCAYSNAGNGSSNLYVSSGISWESTTYNRATAAYGIYYLNTHSTSRWAAFGELLDSFISKISKADDTGDVGYGEGSYEWGETTYAEDYGNFIKSFKKNPSITKDSETDGNIKSKTITDDDENATYLYTEVSGIKFATIAVGTKGNDFQWLTVEATLADGSTTTNCEFYDSDGNKVETYDLKAGVEYTVRVYGTSSSTVVKSIKVTNYYYYYYAAMIYLRNNGSGSSGNQDRAIAGAKRELKSDEVVFELNEGNPPKLIISKVDAESGERVGGSTLTVSVGSSLSKQTTIATFETSSTTDYEIDLKDYVDSLNLTNKVYVVITETSAADGYVKWTYSKAIKFTFNSSGEITSSITYYRVYREAYNICESEDALNAEITATRRQWNSRRNIY